MKKNYNKPMSFYTESIPMTRISPAMKVQLLRELQSSHHRTMAALVREKLANTQITEHQRKKVDALVKVGEFRSDLNRIGNNVNQIAKVINTYKNGQLFNEEVIMLEELLRELARINEFLDGIRL